MFGFKILLCESLLVVFICLFSNVDLHVSSGYRGSGMLVEDNKMPESAFLKEIQSTSSTKLDVNVSVFIILVCQFEEFTIS